MNESIIIVIFVNFIEVHSICFQLPNSFSYPFLFSVFPLPTREDLHKSSFIYTIDSWDQTERDEICSKVVLRLLQSFIQKYTLHFKSMEFL